MGSFIDLTNKIFGRLTVIKRNGYDNSGKIMWQCKCSCGTIKNVRGADLRSGKIISCGCLGKENRQIKKEENIKLKENTVSYYKDLKGQTFNKLTVISFDAETTLQKKLQSKKSVGSWWICKCECGNIVSINGTSLTKGHTKSCGCLLKEISKKNMKKIQPIGAKSRLIDLSGNKYGKLTVIQRDEQNSKQNKPMWLCQCECGNKCIVNGESLKSGDTQSCGCLGKSKGEYIIKNILLENNIPFQQEVSFPDLKDKNYLRFDFALLDKNGKIKKLIEFDGRQHSDSSSIWYNETVILHDKMKTNYCKDNNIPLLRINYKEIDSINLQMLIS